MKKLVIIMGILVFAFGFSDEVLDQVMTEEIKAEETVPAPKTTTKPTVKSTTKPVKSDEDITTKEETNKPVNTKVSLKLKISKNVPAIKNGEVIVTVYEYNADSLNPKKDSEEVFYNDYSIKHSGKADTAKTFTVNIKKDKNKKYYAVIEVVNNKTLDVYEAIGNKSDLGEILTSETASQIFIVDEEQD